MSIRKAAAWTAAICLSTVAVLESQPPGGPGSGFPGGGMVSTSVMQAAGASPDQVFALLAFDEKFNLTDEQLPGLREALRPLYLEQRQALAQLLLGAAGGGGGNPQAMVQALVQQQSKMRDKVLAAVDETLTDEQMAALKAALQQPPLPPGMAPGSAGPRGVPRPPGGGF